MGTAKYKHIIVNFTDLSGNIHIRKIRVVNEGYHLFFNCQHILIKVPSEARAFFDFLCEKMRSDNNSIKIDKSLKENFIEQISRITSKKVIPAANSLNKYVSEFKQLGLILSLKNTQRGSYFLNPKYVYKGYRKDRIHFLKTLIEERIASGQSLAHLVDRPEQFFKS